ncbi:uncharacterized protein LOC127799669 [Diospyros lotus]|uniref:uncharacterized protein LOC127799669 n=1 Tax=Diospyros lotus TaxID=55363 RepID=UPI0022538A03|nr:uncharacterized protein LOC127799669 [Diospyros lotus]
MIQALNPSSSTISKTAEILSRYRPIAPRPDVPANPTDNNNNGEESEKIKQSPYLRNVWPQLQARPTRTRKRGRNAFAPPPPMDKRPRAQFFGFSPPCRITTTSPAKSLALQGFAHGVNSFNINIPQLQIPSFLGLLGNPDQLPLSPCPSLPILAHQPPPATPDHSEGDKGIDLNKAAEVPEEKDLLQQLQEQRISSNSVITPRPVRPVGSTIIVRSINEEPGTNQAPQVPKKREEVEEEIELEALPAVVSDSNNKVRLANSAYKTMVGQPECSWLDCTVKCDGRHSACKRICGEVVLQFSDKSVPVSATGFSCWVTIEWGSNGKHCSVHAFCDAMRLWCESRDYLFAWRIHTGEASDLSRLNG